MSSRIDLRRPAIQGLESTGDSGRKARSIVEAGREVEPPEIAFGP
jgi:hypothetical protein